MLPYASLPDSPDTPTDVDHSDEYSPFSDTLESLQDTTSPLDPSYEPSREKALISRSDTFRTMARSTGGTEFFSAIVLDMPRHADDSTDGVGEGERNESVWDDIGQSEEEEGEEGEKRDYVGGTLPLRIQKRLQRKATSKHRSIISGPVSPRSNTFSTIYHTRPASPSLSRNNTTSTTSSSIHPHQSISRLFLEGSPVSTTPSPPVPVMGKSISRLSSMPTLTVPTVPPVILAKDDLALPSPGLPLPTPPRRPNRRDIPVRPIRTRRISSATSGVSNYHLNLGKYSDEAILPGLSPPGSPSPSVLHPLPSPSLRTVSSVASPLAKAAMRHKLPASPVTPSRAPAKAVKLLGTETPIVPPKQSVLGVNIPTSISGILKTDQIFEKRRDNYRPLPTQTLIEIERFFGEVPRKPKTVKPRMKIVHLGAIDFLEQKKNVGEGNEVRYRDGRGVVWRDMEEEQEFAWLMAQRTPPSSDYTPLSGPLAVSSKAVQRSGKQDGGGLSHIRNVSSDSWTEETSEEEKIKGDETFKSVLDMPRPVKIVHPYAMASQSNTKSSSNRWVKSSKSTKPTVKVDESFMDFGSDIKKTPPKSTKSSETKTQEVLRQTVEAGAQAVRPVSPPRIKNRPPPLTLRPGKKNPNLPLISISPSPTVSKSQVNKLDLTTSSNPEENLNTATPETPFVRPRRAPKPAFLQGGHALPPSPPLPNQLPIALPSLPPLPSQLPIALPSLPPIPPLPIPALHPTPNSLPLPHIPLRSIPSHSSSVSSTSITTSSSPSSPPPSHDDDDHMPRRPVYTQSKAARLLGLDPMEDPMMGNISFFEPDSPVRSKSGMMGDALRGNTTAAAGGGRGGGGGGGSEGTRRGGRWLKKMMAKGGRV